MPEVTDRGEKVRLRRVRPYPEYRDSGVEWLGTIPANWEVDRLKYLATLNDETLPESTDPSFEMAYVDISSVDAVAGITQTEALVFDKAPSRARRVVRSGDVIVSTVRTYLRAIASIETPNSDLIVSTGFAVLRPRRLESSFASYALRAPQFVERVVANSVGVSYPAINASSLACFPIPFPDADEQRTIADFLDRETAKIDALVARKERLIELLQEKRTALITRAVTRGLDPNVPMKDSGVEWLGEIPAHWKLMPLKRILNRCNYGISESLGDSGDIRVLTMAHIQHGEIVLPDDGCIDAVDRTLVLEPGDLLFNRTNSRELVGKVGIFRGRREDRVTFASYLVRLTAREHVEPEWLNYLLNSTGVLGMARRMALLSVNQANLNPTKYRQVVVPIPGLFEQQTIAGFVRCETTRIDNLVSKIQKAIDHLREFRNALISAAVTGKIDVRATSADATAGQGGTR